MMEMIYRESPSAAFARLARDGSTRSFRWCPSCGVTGWKTPLGNDKWVCPCGHVIEESKHERDGNERGSKPEKSHA
jgi:hypothetical protein